MDLLRDDLWKSHPQIQIVDFDFYDVNAFNQCENNNCVLMAVPKWQYVHPLLKILAGGLELYHSLRPAPFAPPPSPAVKTVPAGGAKRRRNGASNNPKGK